MNDDLTSLLLLLGKATLLLAAALAATRALARVNPRWRLLICEWTAAAVLLLPPALLFPGFGPAVPFWAPAAPAAAGDGAPLDLQLDPLPADGGGMLAAETGFGAGGQSREPRGRGVSIVFLASALYLAGVAAFSLYRLLAKRRLRREVCALPEAGAGAQSVLDAVLAARAAAPGGRPLLFVAPDSFGPFCCRVGGGEAIVVPGSLAGGGDREALTSVLHHELQHLANRDLLRIGLMFGFHASLWFHPLAWALRRRHAAVVEELGDRVAAAQVGRERYRSSLARLALKGSGTRPQPLGAVGFSRTPDILTRLRLLTRSVPHAPLGGRRATGAAALATLFALLVSGIRPAEARTDRAPDSGAAAAGNAFLAELGGGMRAEVAVSARRAFGALLAHQDDDGGFAASDADRANAVALTALAATAMRAHGGADPDSPYREPMRRALGFVLNCQRDSGVFYPSPEAARPGSMYHHCIATWGVASTLDLLPRGERREARRRLGRAVDVLVAAQSVPKAAADQGGWRYTETSRDSDLSCSVWALRALAAARRAKIEIPQGVFDDAIGYVKRTQNDDGGFRYTVAGPQRSSLERAAMGLYCLRAGGMEPASDDRGSVERATAFVLGHLPGEGAARGPYHHYGLLWSSAALASADAEAKGRYLRWLVPHCLSSQNEAGWGADGRGLGGLLNTLCVLHAYAPAP